MVGIMISIEDSERCMIALIEYKDKLLSIIKGIPLDGVNKQHRNIFVKEVERTEDLIKHIKTKLKR